jgi:hypothetical protein
MPALQQRCRSHHCGTQHRCNIVDAKSDDVKRVSYTEWRWRLFCVFCSLDILGWGKKKYKARSIEVLQTVSLYLCTRCVEIFFWYDFLTCFIIFLYNPIGVYYLLYIAKPDQLDSDYSNAPENYLGWCR